MSEKCRVSETCETCEQYETCQERKERDVALESIIKAFEFNNPGKRFRKGYGKHKRISAARLKVKR